MNWIKNVVRPKIRGIWRKRDGRENKWVKCPETGQMVFHRDLEANQFVIPGSGYHMRMAARTRLERLFDGGEFEQIKPPEVPLDPLKFRDERRYTDRLKDARAKTGLDDAILLGTGRLDGLQTVAAMPKDPPMNAKSCAAAGGARMQEGILSLMQMPRTTIAVQRLREARLPYLVVLTHPTTGGVTASYAMLGDIHIAEPGALIGFAGPRVIEQTIREKLPAGFQRAEYLLEHGMVDMVVHRHDLRATLSRLCRMLLKAPALTEIIAAPARANGPVPEPGQSGEADTDTADLVVDAPGDRARGDAAHKDQTA